MKLKVTSKELKKALSKLSTVPGAATDRVISIVTDMEGATLMRQTVSSQINVSLDCEIEDTGEAFIDSNWLTLFAAKVDGDVEMELVKGDKLLVSSGKMESNIKVIREGYTFEARTPEDGVSWKIDAGRLFDIIEATLPAMGVDGLHKEREGLLIQKQDDGHVWCAGTDGRRGHCLRTNAKDELYCLIPTEVVKCLQKVLAEEDRETKITFSIGKRTVTLQTPGTKIVSQLYGDKIQNFKPFLDIKQDDGPVIVVNRRLLLDHVLAAMAFSKMKQVNLIAKGKKLTIEAEDPEAADFTSEIALEKKATMDFEICLNGHYFTDQLRAVKTQDIELTTVKSGLGIWFFGGDVILGLIAIRNKPASQ